MPRIKISQLPQLTTGSAETELVGNFRGTTYRISLSEITSSIVQMISESIDNRLDLLENFQSDYNQMSSSIISIEQLNLFTQSADNRLDTLESFSSSADNRYVLSGSIQNIDLPNGIISSSNQITALGFITGVIDIDNYVTTASYNLDSASFDSRILAATNEQFLGGFATTASLNTLSTSVDSRLDILESFSSSADNRYVLSGSITQTTWDNIANKPNDIISSSTQIAALGFITGVVDIDNYVTTSSFNSFTQSLVGIISSSTQITEYGFISESIDISSLNLFTQSAEQRIGNLEAATASYLTSLDGAISTSGQVDYTQLQNLPNNLISSSQQINDYGFVTGAFVTINEYNQFTQSIYEVTQSFYSLSGSFNSIDFTGIHTITASYLEFTQSYYSASASFDSRIDGLQNATSSYLTSLDGTISSSTQIAELGFITGVLDIDNYVTTSSFNLFTQSLTGTISSSTQISEFGFVSGSYETTGRGIISSSLQTTDWGYTTTTSFNSFTQSLGSTISSSQQIAALGFITGVIDIDNYVTTASYNLDSASFSSRIYAATNEQFLGGYTTTSSFNLFTSSLAGAISSSTQISVYGFVSSSITASTLTTASFNNGTKDLTFTKGDGTTFSVNIPDVSGSSIPNGTISSSAQISAFGFISSSQTIDTASFVTTSSFNSFTQSYQSDSASFDTRIIAATNEQNLSGYATTSSLNTISASAWGAYASASSYSSSISTSLSNVSASLNTFSSSYKNDSSSFDSRIINLSVAGTPAGTISSSAQIAALGYATTSSINSISESAWGAFQSASSYSGSFYTTINNLSGAIYLTDVTQSNNISTVSASAWGAFQSASSYSASVATSLNNASASAYLTFAKLNGGNTFNGNQTINGDLVITGSLTAQNLIFSSSVYHTTASFSSGSTIFGNTMDDTHLFTGSVSITGSLTASLQTGYAWVGNGNNVSVTFPTASLLSTASFNSWTGSAFNTLSSSVAQVQTNLNTFTASLGVTTTAFTYTSVVNPTDYVLVSYPTASFNGGSMDIIVSRASDGTAVSNICLIASYGGTGTIASKGSQNSGAGAPNPSFNLALSGSNMNIRISLASGTYNIKGVARLF